MSEGAFLSLKVAIYSLVFFAAFFAGAFLAATFLGAASSLATFSFAGFATFFADGAAAFTATLLGRALPNEPLNLLPFSVLLSPLPMIVIFLDVQT